MKICYDPETLRTVLEPENEDESLALVTMLQVFSRGGTIKAKQPDQRKDE